MTADLQVIGIADLEFLEFDQVQLGNRGLAEEQEGSDSGSTDLDAELKVVRFEA